MNKWAWISIFSVGAILDYVFGVMDGVVCASVTAAVVGSLISAAGSIGGGLLANKKQNVEQVPLETPEQTEARQILLQFAKSGRLGDITAGGDIPGADFGAPLPGFDAGADLGLSLGQFDIQPTEQLGFEGIESLLTTISPSILDPAQEKIESLLEGTDIDAFETFGPFKERLTRELKESSDIFKREQAFGRNLFSTGTQRGLSEIASRGFETKAIELARLKELERERQSREGVQGTQLAIQLANLQNQLETSRLIPGIQSALQFGGLERNLGDISVLREREEALRQRGELRGELGRQREEELTDISRRRGEELARLDALRTVLGSSAPFGIPSINVPQASPFQGAFDTLGGIGGDIFKNSLLQQRTGGQTKSVPATTQFGGSGTATA